MFAIRIVLVAGLATVQLAGGAAEQAPPATNSAAHTYRNPLLPDIEMADPDVGPLNPEKKSAGPSPKVRSCSNTTARIT
jgi:hypothetical protein